MVFSLNGYFFEDYLSEANRATSANDLFYVLLQAINRHGFDSALFSLITDHDDIGQKADFGIICSYSESWMSHYFERWCRNIDPAALDIARHDEVFFWGDMPELMRLRKDQHALMFLESDACLRCGLAVPLRGMDGQFAALGFAATEKKDSNEYDLDMVTAYANHFYVAYKRLYRKEDRQDAVFLTPKEREVLTWVASGKTDSEIASILNLSRNTIDAHVRKVFKKLNANSRVLASVKAISMGLIHI